MSSKAASQGKLDVKIGSATRYSEVDRPRCDVVKANGLIYLVDSLSRQTACGERTVYPYHDEAADLLELAMRLGDTFNLVVDGFSGGGHSMLPLLDGGIVDSGAGIDINPRAVRLARLNAELNGIAKRAKFAIGDVRVGLPIRRDRTLYIGNAPFALTAPEVRLELMRDGGKNGLALTLAFVHSALRQAKRDDVICGVSYSLVSSTAVIELEQRLLGLLGNRGALEVRLIEEARIWRGPNGKKEQSNPMPLFNMSIKGSGRNPEVAAAYDKAARIHKKQGWEKLGYFEYVIWL